MNRSIHIFKRLSSINRFAHQSQSRICSQYRINNVNNQFFMPRHYASGKEQAIPNFMNRIFDKVQKASIEVSPTSPAEIVKQDLVQLQQNIIKLLTTDHPFLKLVAQYYVDLGGTKIKSDLT